ncbi:two-component system sensor histidine kinase NtrB [Alienimonas californiensis]|uniref:histidine kinase n=1 Tax=Alienimonas californiensis TaxID=2527989 RepID=A0A517PA08_9PLAN|nr:ATP-binding protein [Alienimonas californiensis]QDT16210.1 Sporulation kinase E [Alienimonas californiensis]
MPEPPLGRKEIDDALFRYVANFTYDWESWHDPAGTPVWINDAVERVTGYGVEECLAMPEYPVPIVDPNDRDRLRQMLREGVEGRSHNDLEFRVRTKAGERRWMAVSWQPMSDDRGRPLGFRTSVRDIADRQALREKLRLQNERLERLVRERTAQVARLLKNRGRMERLAAVGELAAGVAHEINNPLAGIRNAFALIGSSLAPDHPHYELIELVDAEIERISAIIHQMYQLYRSSPLRAEDLAVEKVVRDVFCLLDLIADRHGVRLTVARADGSPEPTAARLPENELKQVLFNLVRNAVQASEPGGEVRVEIAAGPAEADGAGAGADGVGAAEADVVAIAVVDQGTGIDADTLPRIFEPFFSTKGKLKEGMGLGLSVTQNLVAAMGGEIVCETEPGIGTTFRVTLPRRTPQPGDGSGVGPGVGERGVGELAADHEQG